MATDIAFALGVLALAGSGVPVALRIFLLALATVDDIGAILVIAVFYSERLSLVPLGLAVLLLVLMVAMLRLGIQNLIYYLPVAVFFWFAVLQSGIHATIAGVAMGLIAPTSAYIKKETFVKYLEPLLQDAKLALAGRQEATAEAIFGEVAELSVATESIADRLVRVLHPWSSYLVLPLFAFANTGLFLSWDLARQAWGSPITRGVVAGLVLGKVAGIVLFAWIAVRLGAARLLSGVRWAQMASVGLLGGIGFTVSLFISELALGYPSQVAEAKVGILLASVLSGIAGYGILRLTASGSGSSAVAGGEDMKNTVPRRETDVVLSTT